MVAWATDVSVTIVPEGMSATEESDFVPVMGMGVEMMLVRAVASSEAVVSLASFAVVVGAVDELPEPPVIVNLGLELPESPKTDHPSGYTQQHTSASLTNDDIVRALLHIRYRDVVRPQRDGEALRQWVICQLRSAT